MKLFGTGLMKILVVSVCFPFHFLLFLLNTFGNSSSLFEGAFNFFLVHVGWACAPLQGGVFNGCVICILVPLLGVPSFGFFVLWSERRSMPSRSPALSLQASACTTASSSQIALSTPKEVVSIILTWLLSTCDAHANIASLPAVLCCSSMANVTSFGESTFGSFLGFLWSSFVRVTCFHLLNRAKPWS